MWLKQWELSPEARRDWKCQFKEPDGKLRVGQTTTNKKEQKEEGRKGEVTAKAAWGAYSDWLCTVRG